LNIINSHNKRLLNPEIQPPRDYNCRNNTVCPLDGKCLTKCIIYQAKVTTKDGNQPQTYVGTSETEFKTRLYNHKSTFNNKTKKNHIELSKYIWELKDKKTNFNITWKIMKKTNSYNRVTKRCNLCLWEKYFIVYQPSTSSLNNRNVILSTCRHAR